MRFSFKRSSVLGRIIRLPRGYYQIKMLSFSHPIKIQVNNIRLTLTKHLHGMSCVVVDPGPKGIRTKEVVIAVGSNNRLRQLRSNL